MKQIIISSSQLSLINEGVSNSGPIINVSAKDIGAVPEAGEEAANKIAKTGARSAQINVTPNNTDPNRAVSISGKGDSVADQLEDATTSAVESGMDKSATTFTAKIGAEGKPLNSEGKIYSKKAIEEARINSLRESKLRYTKRELNNILYN